MSSCRPMISTVSILNCGESLRHGRVLTNQLSSRLYSVRVRCSMVDSTESSSNFAKRMERAWLISQQPTPIACSSCDSNGHVECEWCRGTGFFILGDNMLCQVPSRNTSCVICGGKGSKCCANCKGTGFRAKWLEEPPTSKLHSYQQLLSILHGPRLSSPRISSPRRHGPRLSSPGFGSQRINRVQTTESLSSGDSESLYLASTSRVRKSRFGICASLFVSLAAGWHHPTG